MKERKSKERTNEEKKVKNELIKEKTEKLIKERKSREITNERKKK